MDPKTQMPDIKAEVLKTDDGKKKGAGLLGLFGGGGGGAAGGLGGLGAGAAGGGGLLATKAGMLALVLIGTSVAGGIGVAGYKIFGPGEADRTGGNLSLFAPKPPQAAADASAGAVNPDGSSQSLSLMAQSAAKDREPEVSASAAAAAPTDAVAGDAAKDPAAEAAREAAARAAAGGAINSGGGAGAVGSMKGLANVKKLGALSGATGGGASTTAGSGTVGKLGDGLAAGSRAGSTSGFSRSGPGAKASGAKGRAARGGRGARAQARNVMGDQAGGRAGSSFAAGRTYDGSATQSGGAIGPDGGAIGMDGVGDGGAGEQPKALAANSAKNSNEQEPPPAKPDPIVTPWEKALNMAMGAVVVAGLLMMAASALLKDLNPVTKSGTLAFAKVLLGLAVLAAAAALFFAGQATFGPGGQKLQGGLIMAAATFTGGLAGYMLSQIWSDPATDAKTGLLVEPVSPMLIKVIGGAAAVAVIGSMMAPKQTMKESEAKEKGYPTSYHAPAPAQDYRV